MMLALRDVCACLQARRDEAQSQWLGADTRVQQLGLSSNEIIIKLRLAGERLGYRNLAQVLGNKIKN
jgi:hypothetical protein